MSGTENHRVLSRPAAMTIAAITLALGAALVWAGMLWVESYGERISVLQAMSPEEAAAKLTRDLKALAIGFFIALGAASATLGWYCLKAMRSQSMPPTGSWIVHGQYVRRGREAQIAAWMLMAVAGLLALAAIVSSYLLWRLASAI